MANELTWIEIDKKAVKNNIASLRRAVGRSVILAPCMKANAYGHGLVAYSKLALKYGADWVCVNSIFEAEALRSSGVKRPILVIGYIQQSELRKVLDLDVKCVLYSPDNARRLSRLAKSQGRKAAVHIKIDTGMSRQGVLPGQAEEFVQAVRKLPGLYLEGVGTHFASSDELGDLEYFRGQLEKFEDLRKKLANYKIPLYHSGNSAAAMLHKEARYGLVRPGLASYGYYASPAVGKECQKQNIILKPALSLKTKIALVKELPKGIGVSYGSTYKTKGKTRVAVLPIGYYDGVDRKLSNQGEVLINGVRCPVRGRVCMNMTVVDISRAGVAGAEDEAVLIGRQGRGEITVEDWAKWIGTINYEVTTRLREGIQRRYI